MSRVILPVLLFVLSAFAVVGCGSSGVGEPCDPAHPAPAAGQPMCGSTGCFSGREIYIETRSLQCRTRVCMVYKWDEASQPDDHSRRVFCTCRCGGEGDPTSFCACPDEFTCTTAFVAGEPGIRGSYCVRNSIPGISDAGTTAM